jgi:hypothetical protein
VYIFSLDFQVTNNKNLLKLAEAKMLTNSKKMRGPRGLQGQRLHWAFLGPQPERRELEEPEYLIPCPACLPFIDL